MRCARWLTLGLGFLARPAAADPWDDPTVALLERALRIQRVPAVLGGGGRSPLALVHLLVDGDPRWADDLEPEVVAVIRRELGSELAAAEGENAMPWVARPGGRLAVGTEVPDYLGGDEEPGLASLRARLDLRAYPSIGRFRSLDLAVVPETELDAGGGVEPGAALREAWVGMRTAHVDGGFGLRDRWIGPARHGGLLLTDNARPAPLGLAGWRGRLGWKKSHASFHAGVGWLDGTRTDVERPGWLLMDARWSPHPVFELGATRMAIFGGVGRPTPDIGQLLVPTEPHVYNDPNKLLADQDELGALDFRGTLPLGWLGKGAPDYLELYWQYGGEDVIARKTLGIPYPALAGVANLYGGELVRGPWALTVEGTRVLDDYFRWYTGHRIYHQGFVRDGRAMGEGPGGDSLSQWAALGCRPARWGGELWVEHIRRVGVIASEGEHILALATDEQRHRLGIEVWHEAWPRGWWRGSISIERVRGLDFVPGRDGWTWRVAIGRQ